MATLTLDPPVRAEPTAADRLAQRNRDANLAILTRTQPRLVSSIGACTPDMTWVFARDGFLTAFDSDDRWLNGCSVPLLAARAILKTLEPGTGVACFLSPSHSAHVRVALELLSPSQALICIVPNVSTVNVMLHCEDFSADLSRGRLWFAVGAAWADELSQILENAPGLATPSRFIRLPHGDAAKNDDLIVEAQRVLTDQNARRTAAIAELRTNWQPNRSDAPRRLCVIARSTFRLWDDAGHALHNAITADGSSHIECHRFDPDHPAESSPLALANTMASADAVISADIVRADAPRLAADSMPWITWVTSSKIPSFQSAGPNDSLLLADPDWLGIARHAGWPAERISIAGWPNLLSNDPSDTSNRFLALIADTTCLDAPTSLSEFSSHGLLWDKIRATVLRNPFTLPDDIEQWLQKQAEAEGIAVETLHSATFIQRLIVPAYQQGLADVLVNAGFPVRLFGAVWLDLPRFLAHAAGPVTSRDQLTEIARSAAGIIHAAPHRGAHPADAFNRPVIGRHESRESFVREAKRALTSSAMSSAEACRGSSIIPRPSATTAQPAGIERDARCRYDEGMPPARRCWLIAALAPAALLHVCLNTASAQRLPAGVGDLDLFSEPEPVPVEDVIRFSLRGSDLGISSNMKPADGRRRVSLQGIEGNTRVEVGRRMRGPVGLTPFFEMVHTGAASDDGSGSSQTSIYAQGSVVRIERTVQVGDLHTTVKLRQDGFSRNARPVEPRGNRMTLQVRTTRVGVPVEDVRVSAGSFAELLRKFPAPAARHLAPFFRQFGQETTIFRIEPELAWQLFPDAVEPDERSTSKVLELVDRLNAADFRERDLATAELEVMGGPALTALGEIDRASLSAEQNTRIDAILNRYRRLSEEEIAEMLNDPEFLLRCFTYSDLQPIRAAAAAALVRRLGETIEIKESALDYRAKLPSRIRAAEAVREKLPIQKNAM